jgi:hypothetical protein
MKKMNRVIPFDPDFKSHGNFISLNRSLSDMSDDEFNSMIKKVESEIKFVMPDEYQNKVFYNYGERIIYKRDIISGMIVWKKELIPTITWEFDPSNVDCALEMSRDFLKYCRETK